MNAKLQLKFKDYFDIRLHIFTNFMKKLHEISEKDWHNILWKPFWLLISALILGSIFIWAEVQKVFLNRSSSEWLLIFGLSVITLIILDFIFNPRENLRIQKIRNQPSWIYYGFWGFAFGPATVTFLLVAFHKIGYEFPKDLNSLLESQQIYFNVLFSFIFLTILRLNPKKELKKENLRFASGAVGIENDEFDFKDSAQNVALGLQEIQGYVNVICLYGGLGFGKSSYARMIIESLDRNKTLYTYISLTETNEAKDFSKLFAERWMGTLKQRYPSVDTTLSVPLMQSVLRESGNGLISSIFSIIPWLNKGLIKTSAKYFDNYYKSTDKNPKTSNEVANLFGNVLNIEENIWIVMIDEIERAQFDEVYHVIEIIERFKNEGRVGLPTKLIFMLCISSPEFQMHINNFKKIDPKVPLIDNFLNDGKSITNILFLPPTQGKMAYYITNKIKQFSLKFNLMTKDIINDIYPDTFSDPTTNFFEDDKKSLSYAVGKLSTKSTRLIFRCFQGLEFFYALFRNKSQELQKPNIRLGDLLMMEYVKIKYPYLILFFERTIMLLLANYNEAGGSITYQGLSTYLQKEKLKKTKKRLADWVNEITGFEISETEKEEIEAIIGSICYSYFDYLRGDHHTKKAVTYSNSLALPKNLYDYLSIVSDAIVTSFDRYSVIYHKHKDKKIKLKELSLSDLVGYSRFMIDIRGLPINLHIDLINEIARRILDKDVKFTPNNVGDTVYDDFIYQFIFQVMNVTEKDRKSRESASPELTIAYNKLKNILQSPNVTTGAKYVIINSFANNRRGNSSEIHLRLGNAFSAIQKFWGDEFKDIIDNVFTEAERRYYIDKKVIYKNEENFFYTMYQGWSGKASEIEEIKKIRDVAIRDLDKYPDAIALYWRRYKISEEWADFGDVLRDDPFFGHERNFELYMPLKTLIEVTENANIDDEEVKQKLAFWRKVVDDQRYKEFAIVRDDLETLKAVLISRDLLPKS